MILDEPTAVLTPQETDKLFSILRSMRDQGCAVIIITHKLNEVLARSAARVTIHAREKTLPRWQRRRLNAQELTELMVGKKVSLPIEKGCLCETGKGPVHEVHHLSVPQ
ncbi:MAG: hypothetical protein ACLTB5_15995 [Acutalibacteraceae bacterium]